MSPIYGIAPRLEISHKSFFDTVLKVETPVTRSAPKRCPKLLTRQATRCLEENMAGPTMSDGDVRKRETMHG